MNRLSIQTVDSKQNSSCSGVHGCFNTLVDTRVMLPCLFGTWWFIVSINMNKFVDVDGFLFTIWNWHNHAMSRVDANTRRRYRTCHESLYMHNTNVLDQIFNNFAASLLCYMNERFWRAYGSKQCLLKREMIKRWKHNNLIMNVYK